MPQTYIDVHVLQTVPPSNLNRDDNGSPKTAIYGGVRRARVSSQAWKHATRHDFDSRLDSTELGERTLVVAERIADLIRQRDPELSEQALKLSAQALEAAKIKVTLPKAKTGKNSDTAEEDKARTGYLLFLSRAQMEALADLVVSSDDHKVSARDAKKALTESRSIDLALFGRMVADAPDLNVDATAQVAHAISVHAVESEFDYFTAVDDNQSEDNAGAGMIGTVEFNSSTLYRYATVNATELASSLGSVAAAAKAVEAFLGSFVRSMPTGKQNTFANRTLPDLVLVTVREDQPINLVGAFEDAITLTDGRVAEATRRLVTTAQEIDEAYGKAPEAAFALAVGAAAAGSAGETLSTYAERKTLPDLVTIVGQQVVERGEAS